MSAFDCRGCGPGSAFPIDFSVAFQPIVDAGTNTVFAHEALARGPNGEGAATVLSAVDDTNRYAFDQQCRIRAIEHAARLGLPLAGSRLSINFLPNAVYEPAACIRLTLATAKRTNFPLDRLIFEFTEVERVDTAHLDAILRTYKAIGFATAIDDFGAGYAGLNLLAKFQPDIVKIDMDMIRGIDASAIKRCLVRNIVNMCRELGVTVVAEGVETTAECTVLRSLGIDLLQGYLFARPAFQALAEPSWPADRSDHQAAIHVQ